MKSVKVLATVTLMLTLMGLASAQTWTPLKNPPGVNIGAMIQLRDGRVFAHQDDFSVTSNAWHILTPDKTGSYVNGTWSAGGNLPAGYAPFYFSSHVFLDGRHILIEGGEYNNGTAVWTTLGAYGTIAPFTGKATFVKNAPPLGWSTIGDAQSIILADGRYLQANCCNIQSAFFKAPNSWTASGNIAGSDNDEQGYTLLPSGKLLMVEAWTTTCFGNDGSELFNPASNTWACAAATPTQLWDNSGHELGPAILMYNGKVFQVGATNATAVYTPSANTWAAGPTPAGGLTGYDAPAALLPNGQVLVMLGPSGFNAGCQMELYNPATNKLTNTTNPAACPSDPTFVGHFMLLPTGQVLFSDFSGNLAIYTPAAGVVASAIPKITSIVHKFTHGSKNNVLAITGLNGLSQGAAYGDDYQPEANYPLIRLKATNGNVTYAFTHNDSTHSIAPGTKGTTMFDLPTTLGAGSYSLYVVVNGISSAAFQVTLN